MKLFRKLARCCRSCDEDLTVLVALLNRSHAKIDQLTKEIHTMALDLTALKDAVAANTSVDQSAITLINGLAAKIQELINASGNTVDPAELQAIVDGITADNQTLASAVAANTPAQP